MQTDRSHFPVWLWYALLGIFLWGLWGFLSKVGSGTASPMQMQILFTLGMLPVAIGMLLQMGGKLDSRPCRYRVWSVVWHCYWSWDSRIFCSSA